MGLIVAIIIGGLVWRFMSTRIGCGLLIVAFIALYAAGLLIEYGVWE